MKPIGYHSASTPSLRMRPATLRNDAADRYSPEMAAALRVVDTARLATRKSGVVLALRAPTKPSRKVSTATNARAPTPHMFLSTYPRPRSAHGVWLSP